MEKAYSAVSGSMTKIRAEQIKGEDAALITLAGELAAIKGQIQDIIGDSAVSYKEEVPADVRLLDLAVHLDASEAELQILTDLVASGSVKIDGDKDASVGALYLVGASKEIAETESVIFAEGALAINGNLEAVNADFSGTLDVADAAVLGSTLEVVGAVALNSTLTVTGSAVLESTLNVQGTADFDDAVNFDGAVDMKAALMVTGSASMEDTLHVGGAVDFASTLDVVGAVDLDSTLTVAGAADFNGGMAANEIKIDSDTAERLYIVGADGEIKDEEKLTFDGSELAITGDLAAVNATLSGDLAAASGSFSGDLSISGNLTVSGTTTTVNTEEVTIADHNVIIDSNNTTGAVIDGAGFTFEGGTGDDLTFQWQATHQDMELKLGASYAKLHIGNLTAADVEAVNGAFSGNMDVTGDITGSNLSIVDVVASGDVSAVNADFTGTLEADLAATLGSTLAVGGVATFSAAITGSAGLKISSGLAAFDGGAVASELRIAGDVAQRLYIVNGDGTIKDEQNLIYTGAQLNVTGVISGSGQVRGASFQAVGLGDVGSLVVQGESQLKGIVKLEPAAEVSGSVVPTVAMAFDLGSSSKRYRDVLAMQANLGAANAVQMLSMLDQKIIKGGSGDLVMSSSVAAGFIKFDDAYRGTQLLNTATAGLKLANSGEWATFAAAFPTVDSILGAFNAIAAGGGAEKGYFVATGSVAAETAVDVSAGAGMADMSFAGLTKDNSMVFFNGQLLRSGSEANLAAPASADYSFDGGASAVKFAFAIEAGDQLVVQKL